MPSFQDWNTAQQASVGSYAFLFLGIIIFVVALVWFLVYMSKRGGKRDGKTNDTNE